MDTILEKDRRLPNANHWEYTPYQHHLDFFKPFNHSYNLDVFKDAISKIKNLKERNVIDDKQFADVLLIIATNFIENEIESRINNKINKSICTFFDK